MTFWYILFVVESQSLAVSWNSKDIRFFFKMDVKKLASYLNPNLLVALVVSTLLVFVFYVSSSSKRKLTSLEVTQVLQSIDDATRRIYANMEGL